MFSATTTPLDLVKLANSSNLSLSFSALAAASTFKISPESFSPSAIILPVVTSTSFFLFSDFSISTSVFTSRSSSTLSSNLVLVSTIFSSGSFSIFSLILMSFPFLSSMLLIKEVVESSGSPSSSNIGVPPKVFLFSSVFDNICLPSTLFGSIPCFSSSALLTSSLLFCSITSLLTSVLRFSCFIFSSSKTFLDTMFSGPLFSSTVAPSVFTSGPTPGIVDARSIFCSLSGSGKKLPTPDLSSILISFFSTKLP